MAFGQTPVAAQAPTVPGNQVASFYNDSSGSVSPSLQAIRGKFGSMDPTKVQTNRRQYYSFVSYPSAGASSIVFFGNTVGTTSRQITNIQQSGRLDNPFLVKMIRLTYFIADPKIGSWNGVGTDAVSLYSDFVNGFFQVGVLQVTVGTRVRMQIPSPFLYCPYGFSNAHVKSAGTSTQSGVMVSGSPWATFGRFKTSGYKCDPAFTLDPTQSWKVEVDFPSGAVSVNATTVISSNALYVGCYLDGIEMRPVT